LRIQRMQFVWFPAGGAAFYDRRWANAVGRSPWSFWRD
jgi:hypothetical protein